MAELVNRGIHRLMGFPVMQFQTYTIFKKVKKKKTEIRSLVNRPPNFSMRTQKRNEANVEGEYCWAITKAAGRSCYGR